MNKLLPAASVLGLSILLLPALNGADASVPTTAKLIEQLGSGSFVERTKADELLRARGPKALPELRRALISGDAEVRRRVQDLIADLEMVAALQPKLVTLKADRQPLSAVLQQLEKQTGYQLQAEDTDEDPLCDLDVRETSYWEAVEPLARSVGRMVGMGGAEEGIRLKKQGRTPFVVVSGPFRLEVTKFHEDRDIDFRAPGAARELGRRDHRLTLTLTVLAEPKFILLAADTIQVKSALDEEQKPLGLPMVEEKRKPGAASWAELLRRSEFAPYQEEALAFLQRSSAKARLIGTLQGTVPVRVVVERKRVVVTENVAAATGLNVQVGQDKLRINQAELGKDGSLLLRIEVPPREPRARWKWHDRVIVEDARGNRYKHGSWGDSTSGGMQEIMLGYAKAQDPKVGPPTRLVIEEWVTLPYAIPFEFKDVPLP